MLSNFKNVYIKLNHQYIVALSPSSVKNLNFNLIFFSPGISAFVKENERWEINEFYTVYCLVKWWRICSSLFIEHRSVQTRCPWSRYVAHSYNMYLFPASFGPVDVRFMVQVNLPIFTCNVVILQWKKRHNWFRV